MRHLFISALAAGALAAPAAAVTVTNQLTPAFAASTTLFPAAQEGVSYSSISQGGHTIAFNGEGSYIGRADGFYRFDDDNDDVFRLDQPAGLLGFTLGVSERGSYDFNFSLFNGDEFLGDYSVSVGNAPVFVGVIGASTAVDYYTGGEGAAVFGDFRVGDSLAGGAPEPATWGMMILGFGMVGAAARQRTRVAA